MSVKGVAIEVEPSCEMWSILLVSGGVAGVVVPSAIFETLSPLMCRAPNEPVEVDEPLINSKSPVLKFVILVENEPLSVSRFVVLVLNEELSVPNDVTLVEKLPESLFRFVTLVEKLPLSAAVSVSNVVVLVEKLLLSAVKFTAVKLPLTKSDPVNK